MRIVVLALALLPAAAIAGERTQPPASHLKLPAKPVSQCQNARSAYAAPAAGEPASVRRLDREPRAGQYLGVLRMTDGCDVPVKIVDQVGDRQR